MNTEIVADFTPTGYRARLSEREQADSIRIAAAEAARKAALTARLREALAD